MLDANERELSARGLKLRLLAEAGSILRFGLVGIAASATYILVALILKREGLSPQIANVVGVTAGTTVSFLGHLFYSFRKKRVTSHNLTRFLLMSAGVYAARPADRMLRASR